MHDPALVTDYRGEWFEVYNNNTDYINLRGMIVAGNGAESFTVEDDFMLANGDYFLFATRDNPEQNGGMTNVDYRYYFDTFALSVLDTISLESQSGMTIDFVSYGESLGFPVAYGASLSLSTMTAAANDDPLNWCVSVTPFGDGDLGTPGWPNDLCE